MVWQKADKFAHGLKRTHNPHKDPQSFTRLHAGSYVIPQPLTQSQGHPKCHAPLRKLPRVRTRTHTISHKVWQCLERSPTVLQCSTRSKGPTRFNDVSQDHKVSNGLHKVSQGHTRSHKSYKVFHVPEKKLIILTCAQKNLIILTGSQKKTVNLNWLPEKIHSF